MASCASRHRRSDSVDTPKSPATAAIALVSDEYDALDSVSNRTAFRLNSSVYLVTFAMIPSSPIQLEEMRNKNQAISDSYGIMDKYILPLAETASKVSSQTEIIEPAAAIENGVMSHCKNDYFILRSPKITVAIDGGSTATVSLSGHNDSGQYIVDEQGDHRTQFSDNESFYVEIPWAERLLNREIDVTVKGDVTLPRAVEYRTSLEGNYERLVGLKEVTAKVTTTVPLPTSIDLAIADYGVMSIGLLVAAGAIIAACRALFKRHK